MAKMMLDNARNPEQRRLMEELVRTGQCHLCREGFENRHKAAIIYEGNDWLITANDFPYEGSVHHYLIVPTQGHPTEISELDPQAWIELQVAINWLENHLKVSGESIFVRSGDMEYTGATLDHLHVHFLVGVKATDETKKIKVTLGHEKP